MCVIECRNGDGPGKGMVSMETTFGKRDPQHLLEQRRQELTSLMALSAPWVILQLSLSDKNKDYYGDGRGGKALDTSPATSPVWPKWTNDCDRLCFLCWIIFLIKWTVFITKKKTKKSCQDAWRSGSQLASGQVNMADGAKFHNQFIQLLKVWLKDWLCHLWSDSVMEKNWAHSVD